MVGNDLVLEFYSEEIPARMQKDARETLERLLAKELLQRRLSYQTLKTYTTSRRLTAHVIKLSPHQEDQDEVKKGPRVNAPDKAIQGFLKTVGLADVSQCHIMTDKKGEFYSYRIEKQGKATETLLPGVVQNLFDHFPWPKSMRWGRCTKSWVRPLHRVICVFQQKCIEGSLDIGGETLSFTHKSFGHPVMSPANIKIKSFDDYQGELYENFVVLDPGQRRDMILRKAQEVLEPYDFFLCADEKLLEEVTGLVEWPVPILGKIPEKYLSLPAELLSTVMRVHQRYFCLKDTNGHLVPYFLAIANIEAIDGGGLMRQGYERVLNARFADALFFFDKDQSQSLESMSQGLERIIFHQDLGTYGDKVRRLETLSLRIATQIGAPEDKVQRAAKFSKTDLASEMVSEFPELQGVMGKYYARNQGFEDEVSQALQDHYFPRGSADHLPQSLTGKTLAIADKIDTLVGFFAKGLHPTGSKDPFGLRRCAIGLIRILSHYKNLSLEDITDNALQVYGQHMPNLFDDMGATKTLLLTYFQERLKIFWKDQGYSHFHIEAVLSFGLALPLPILEEKILSLKRFLADEDGPGQALLAAYRRATNILKIEEKKDKCQYLGDICLEKLQKDEERHLFEKIKSSQGLLKTSLQDNNFPQAIQHLAELRPFVDRFFDDVHVNVEDFDLRRNRLNLLAQIRFTLHEVADFSKIEG